jgi:hypothetical protein
MLVCLNVYLYRMRCQTVQPIAMKLQDVVQYTSGLVPVKFDVGLDPFKGLRLIICNNVLQIIKK